MAQIALEGDAHGAGLQPFADDRLHGRNLVIGGVPFLRRFAHHIATHRRMTDESSDVNAQPLV